MKKAGSFIVTQFLLILIVLSSCKKSSPGPIITGISGTHWIVNCTWQSGSVYLIDTINVCFNSSNTLSNSPAQNIPTWTNTNWTNSGNNVTFSLQYSGTGNTTVTENFTGSIDTPNNKNMNGTFTNSALGSGLFVGTLQ